MRRREPFPFDQELGAVLRDLRREAGMTQRELGHKLGRENSYVSDHERGNCRITVEYLMTFSEILGTHPVDVLGLFMRKQAGVG